MFEHERSILSIFSTSTSLSIVEGNSSEVYTPRQMARTHAPFVLMLFQCRSTTFQTFGRLRTSSIGTTWRSLSTIFSAWAAISLSPSPRVLKLWGSQRPSGFVTMSSSWGDGWPLVGAIFTGPYWENCLCSPSPPNWFYGIRSSETHRYKALATKLRMDTIRGMVPCMNSYKAWAFLQDLESLALRGKEGL